MACINSHDSAIVIYSHALPGADFGAVCARELFFMKKASARSKARKESRKTAEKSTELNTRNRALRVLARMRRGQTLTAASREEHIDPRTVRNLLRAELTDVK